ncbi:MAG: Nramp family divalent metal transporter [Phycisphaerales bacterium]|nr:Nramp family divalent metal transporter [Phycisphaerales bacterium]
MFQSTPDKTTRSLDDVNSTIDTNKKHWFQKTLSFLGPAYLVSVGYMDPGNWATDLQGGAQFGYKLIWILLLSNIIAIVLQNFSARLGIVRRVDLAQANKITYPLPVNISLYILAEISIAACDLAEVLGMALGLHLLTGMPLIYGVCITVLDTFLILWLQRYGLRKVEMFIISLVLLIGVSFFIEIIFAHPQWTEVAHGFIPTNLNGSALYIAVGIIGATVMPHNLYLHSSLVQSRQIEQNPKAIKAAIKFNKIDTVLALNFAFFINAAILIVAASVFYKTGHYQVARIEDAYKLLAPLIGHKIAPIIFAVALIAAGQSSTITGTLAGQIIMEGYLQLRINPWVRRLMTRLLAIIPSVLVILIMGDDKIDSLLILSQVILSLQLSFAVIPLIHFVSDRSTMKEFTISTSSKIIGWVIALLLVYLNMKLVFETVTALMNQYQMHIAVKILLILFFIFMAWLFLAMFFIPILQKNKTPYLKAFHHELPLIENYQIPPAVTYNTIGIAVDFTKHTHQLITQALQVGTPNTLFIFIHVVESSSARYWGANTDDAETRTDKQKIDHLVQQVEQLGYRAQGILGFNDRVATIVKIVDEHQVDLLIMGAHKHKGLLDLILGQTIDKVRHRVNIPILIINR